MSHSAAGLVWECTAQFGALVSSYFAVVLLNNSFVFFLHPSQEDKVQSTRLFAFNMSQDDNIRELRNNLNLDFSAGPSQTKKSKYDNVLETPGQFDNSSFKLVSLINCILFLN